MWYVNILARAVTKWTRECDKRFITHVKQAIFLCGKHSTTMQTWIVSRFFLQETFEDSKSTSGGVLCILGSHTFVPISWMCKKQTSVSQSSTEADVISLDASSRMDGIPFLDLLDLVIEVFHSSPNQTNKTKYVREPRKLVGKHTTKHAKTDSNHAHQFRSYIY